MFIDSTYMFDGSLDASGVPSGSAITASRVSVNTLDLLSARDIGAGAPIAVHVVVTQAFATLTSLRIALQVSATAGGTYAEIISSPTYPVAQLIKGAAVFRYIIPPNELLNSTAGVLAAPGRFLQLSYVVVGSNATTGAVFAYLSPRDDRNQLYVYPNNYTAAVAAGEI